MRKEADGMIEITREMSLTPSARQQRCGGFADDAASNVEISKLIFVSVFWQKQRLSQDLWRVKQYLPAWM